MQENEERRCFLEKIAISNLNDSFSATNHISFSATNSNSISATNFISITETQRFDPHPSSPDVMAAPLRMKALPCPMNPLTQSVTISLCFASFMYRTHNTS